MKKLLLFGAGKIGRSFIGQLFSKSAYEIIFADIDQTVVNLINTSCCYKIYIRDNNHPEKEEDYTVKNISAIHLSDKANVIQNIIDADIIVLSVGKRGLLSLAELLAEGIKDRYKTRKDFPIDIILAENVRNAAGLLRKRIELCIPEFPSDEYIGLIETSIGKMVPNMTTENLKKDPLALIAEPYNSLIVDALAFRNPIPDVKGLVPKNNMKAWVDRKLFIHNMGHVTLAFQANAYDPKLTYTWEALSISLLWNVTRNTMLQSAKILLKMYPHEFTLNQLIAHIDDLLDRFSNKTLGDTIFRVGCDLSRKLGTSDRLMTPILAAHERRMEYNLILEAWVKGCSFKATDEHGKLYIEDSKFIEKYKENPIKILSDRCKLDRERYSSIYDGVHKIINARAAELTK